MYTKNKQEIDRIISEIPALTDRVFIQNYIIELEKFSKDKELCKECGQPVGTKIGSFCVDCSRINGESK